MTTSDPQQILDRIKARAEEQPDDSGSAVELSELLDVARDDSLRLAEALEAVMNEHHKGYLNVRYNRSRIAQCEECQVNWPCPSVRVVEAKLSEGEQETSDHPFLPVAGVPDDDECTHRDDGTDDTYCGLPESDHDWSER